MLKINEICRDEYLIQVSWTDSYEKTCFQESGLIIRSDVRKALTKIMCTVVDSELIRGDEKKFLLEE